jgi:uncharacterized protein YndB with AHSA1/START domain
MHHVVDMDAQPSTVWSAITKADRMAGWWSTKVDAPGAAVGTQVRWTFSGDFNPVMESLRKLCVAGSGDPFKAEEA